MLRILLTSAAVLCVCGCSCNREPQRGPISKVREKIPTYRDNEVEYEFYLNRKGRKVAHGDFTVFYGESNKVYFRGKNKDDKRNGEWTEYTRDGKKRGAISFKDGLLDGVFKAWYLNGQLKVKGQNKRGVQIGEWVYYNDDGQMTKKETWKNGELIKTVRGVPERPPTPPKPTKPDVKKAPAAKGPTKSGSEAPVKKETEEAKGPQKGVNETKEPAAKAPTTK